MAYGRHRWGLVTLVAFASCSDDVQAWRVAASCPVQPGSERQLEFGRGYTLRIETPLFGDPPRVAELVEDGRVTGQVPLDCVTTRVELDTPRWIAPGGATLFDGPAKAKELGRLERDTPVHSVATDGAWHVVAVAGVPVGFVPALVLASRPADAAMLPEFLVVAFAAGGADRILEVLPDLKQKERTEPRVAEALAEIVGSSIDAGDRASAARILEALDHDELTSDRFRGVACRVALSGYISDWDIGADLEAPCPTSPALPEDATVAVEGATECPRDTELLGSATAGTGQVWACNTPDAVLLNRPRSEEVDLSYLARLDHVFVHDRYGRFDDLIDDSGFEQVRREGRWRFHAIHPVGLGACLEWEDSTKNKSMHFLSCFPPPPTNPANNRELIKVGATRRDGTGWHKTWAAVRDRSSYLLCLRSEAKGDEAFRFLPGQIKKTKRWPAACEVTDAIVPRTAD